MPIELTRSKIQRAAPSLMQQISNIASITLAVLAVIVAAGIIILIPTLQLEAVAERQRAEEISDENKHYCEKWGLHAGTKDHANCTMDLDEIRARHEQRIVEQMENML